MDRNVDRGPDWKLAEEDSPSRSCLEPGSPSSASSASAGIRPLLGLAERCWPPTDFPTDEPRPDPPVPAVREGESGTLQPAVGVGLTCDGERTRGGEVAGTASHTRMVPSSEPLGRVDGQREGVIVGPRRGRGHD